jgi:hypothetical protein
MSTSVYFSSPPSTNNSNKFFNNYKINNYGSNVNRLKSVFNTEQLNCAAAAATTSPPNSSHSPPPIPPKHTSRFKTNTNYHAQSIHALNSVSNHHENKSNLTNSNTNSLDRNFASSNGSRSRSLSTPINNLDPKSTSNSSISSSGDRGDSDGSSTTATTSTTIANRINTLFTSNMNQENSNLNNISLHQNTDHLTRFQSAKALFAKMEEENLLKQQQKHLKKESNISGGFSKSSSTRRSLCHYPIMQNTTNNNPQVNISSNKRLTIGGGGSENFKNTSLSNNLSPVTTSVKEDLRNSPSSATPTAPPPIPIKPSWSKLINPPPQPPPPVPPPALPASLLSRKSLSPEPTSSSTTNTTSQSSLSPAVSPNTSELLTEESTNLREALNNTIEFLDQLANNSVCIDQNMIQNEPQQQQDQKNVKMNETYNVDEDSILNHINNNNNNNNNNTKLINETRTIEESVIERNYLEETEFYYEIPGLADLEEELTKPLDEEIYEV